MPRQYPHTSLSVLFRIQSAQTKETNRLSDVKTGEDGRSSWLTQSNTEQENQTNSDPHAANTDQQAAK